jgi:hypothetical protein
MAARKKPPNNPTHPSPGFNRKAFHHITSVEYVRFVGYNWCFLLPPL